MTPTELAWSIGTPIAGFLALVVPILTGLAVLREVTR